MKIYTGIAGGKKLEKLFELELGVMISSTPNRKPNKDLKGLSCALDNGAFACFSKGYPFMEKVFLDTLDASYKAGLKLDFIVTPDIVCGGKKSLDFSYEWATGRLSSCPSLALVVQDGMEIKDVDHHMMSLFTYIFMGGSVDWKWKNATKWKYHAASYGKKFHIGQCGKFDYLVKAKDMSADSVDSTSFVVNETWDIITKLRNVKTLWDKAQKREDRV